MLLLIFKAKKLLKHFTQKNDKNDKNTKEKGFRIENVSKRKSGKLYFKLKGYGHFF